MRVFVLFIFCICIFCTNLYAFDLNIFKSDPDNYEDCVLENIKGVDSKAAIKEIKKTCRDKFPSKGSYAWCEKNCVEKITYKLDNEAGNFFDVNLKSWIPDCEKINNAFGGMLNDGTCKEETKIEFHGEYTDLFKKSDFFDLRCMYVVWLEIKICFDGTEDDCHKYLINNPFSNYYNEPHSMYLSQGTKKIDHWYITGAKITGYKCKN